MGRGYGQKMFVKLVKDSSASIRNHSEAKRFLQGMASFESKGEMLTKLTDTRNSGMERISEVLEFVGCPEDVEDLLISLLQSTLTDETSRPLYRNRRDRVLLEIYNVPGLMSALVEWDVVSHLSITSAQIFCLYLSH